MTIWIKFTLTLILSGYPFMCLHELGHVLSGVLNGGAIDQVILVPWRFSQTVIRGSTNPWMDAWAGPMVGVLLPIVLWAFLGRRPKYKFYVSIFTGFCCVGNGLYLGVGGFDRVGDAGDILRHNGSLFSLIVFGLFASGLGLILWHKALENHRVGAGLARRDD